MKEPLTPFDPEPGEEEVFEELSDEHYEWLCQAIERGNEAMVAAIVASATVEGAVRIGVTKEIFMREMANAYDRAEAKVTAENAEKN
jgi:hypothetical protein